MPKESSTTFILLLAVFWHHAAAHGTVTPQFKAINAKLLEKVTLTAPFFQGLNAKRAALCQEAS